MHQSRCTVGVEKGGGSKLKKGLVAFAQICAEKNIKDAEYLASLSGITIKEIRVSKWLDMGYFAYDFHVRFLSTDERKRLLEMLKSCEVFLR